MEISSTCAEEEVEDSEGDDDISYHRDMERVLDMLNFKLVPKEPGDPGYSRASYLPAEAKMYAVEFCKFRDQISALTNKNVSLEEELETEKQKTSERDQRIQKLEETLLEQREQVKSLSELNDRALNADKMNETLKSQVEALKVELVQKQRELEEKNTQLSMVEKEKSRQNELVKKQEMTISEFKKEVEDAQGIILEREQEIEDHRKAISSLKVELQQAVKARSDHHAAELEKAQKDVEVLQGKLDYMEKEILEVRSELESTKASLQVQLEEKNMECNENKNNLEKSQETIDAMEKQLMELEEKAGEQQAQFKEKVKQWDTAILSKQTQLEVLTKSLDEEKLHKHNLIEKNKILRNGLSSLKSEVELVVNELKCVTNVPDFSTLFQNRSGDDRTREGEVSSQSQEELNGLNVFVSNKFQCWTQNMNLMQDELEKTRIFATSLLKIIKGRPKVLAASTPFPVQPSSAMAISTPVLFRQNGLSSSSYRPPKNLGIRTPINTLPPTSSVVRPSYRDIARLPPSPLINQFSPNVFRAWRASRACSPDTTATATTVSITPISNNMESPSSSYTTVSSSSSNRSIPSLSIRPATKKTVEVRQLFTEDRPATTEANTVRNGMTAASKVHGVDTVKSHLGDFCLCGRKYTSKNSLNIHINYYTKEGQFKCHICHQRFYYLVYLNRHLRCAHKIKNPLNQGNKGCKECAKCFSTIKALRHHQKIAHGAETKESNRMKINVATKQTTLVGNASTGNKGERNQEGGSDHLFSELITGIESTLPASSSLQPEIVKNAIGDQQQPCTSSSLKAPSAEQRNMNLFSKERNFGCSICKKRFNKHGDLLKHLKRVHKILNARTKGLYGCRCGKLFKSMSLLRQHMKYDHGITKKKAQKNIGTQQMPPSPPQTIRKIASTNAGQAKGNSSLFSDDHGIDRLRTRRGDGDQFCKCGLRFQKLAFLRAHVNYYAARAKNLFVCPVCRCGFGAACYLRVHMRRAHNRTFDGKGCRTCGKCFRTYAELCLHRKNAHNARKPIDIVETVPTSTAPNPAPATNDEGEKVGRIASRGRVSANIRQKMTTVKASVVGAPVALKQILVTKKKHGVDLSKRHLGYFCICKTRCTSSNNLNTHIAYFTHEHKFCCQLCSRRFLYLAYLKHHMARVHKVTDLGKSGLFGCRTCGECYSSYQELLQHRKSEHSYPNKREVSVFSKRNSQRNTILRNSTDPIPSTPLSSKQSNSKLSTVRPSCPKTDSSVLQRQHGIDLLKLPTFHICVCGSEFENMKGLQGHIRVNNQENDLTITTTTQQSMNSELSTPNPSQTITSKLHRPVRFSNNSDVFYCFCGLQFISAKLLEKHIQETPNPVVESTPQKRKQVAEAEMIQQFEKNSPNKNALSRPSSFNDLENQNYHDIDTSKDHIGFFCTCGYKLDSNANLTAHIQYFKLGKKFPCDICSKTFSTLKHLNGHKRRVHKISNVTGNNGCNVCGVIFQNKAALSKHWKKIFKPAGKLANIFCPLKTIIGMKNADFNSATGSSSNKRRKLSASTTPAQEIPDLIPSISIRIDPSNNGTEIITPYNNSTEQTDAPAGEMISPDHGVDTSKSAEGYFCYCGVQYSHRYKLNRHIKRYQTMKQARKFSCQACPEMFTCANFLRRHMLRVHKINQNASIVCSKCGDHATFSTYMELYNHNKDVHNLGSQLEPWETKYTPPGSMPSSSRSQQQELSQELSELLELERAGASSTVESYELEQKENHQRVLQDPLSENADFNQCSCGKFFSTLKSLRNHIRMKKSGKIFKCSWCSMSFDSHGNLKQHVRSVHKTDYQKGKYACSLCALTFESLQEVASHRRRVHENNQNNQSILFGQQQCET